MKPLPFHPKNHMTFENKTQQKPVIDLTRDNDEEGEKGESGNESDWESLDETELASIDIMEAIYMEEEERGGQEKLLDPFDDDFEENDFDALSLLPPPALRQNTSSQALAAKNIATIHQTSSSTSGINRSSSLSNKALGSQDREGSLKYVLVIVISILYVF